VTQSNSPELIRVLDQIATELARIATAIETAAARDPFAALSAAIESRSATKPPDAPVPLGSVERPPAGNFYRTNDPRIVIDSDGNPIELPKGV